MTRKLLTMATFMLALLSVGTAYGQNQLLPPPMQADAGAANTASQSTVPVVQYITKEDMERVFRNARESFNQIPAPAGATTQTPQQAQSETSRLNGGSQSQAIAQPARASVQQGVATHPGLKPDNYLPLGEVKIRIAFENMTIEDIMQEVLNDVTKKAGPWAVRWRLQEENRGLVDRRVDINAESSFDAFLSNLTAKINNLTGTRLFIKVFEASRMIIIADSF